MSSHRGGRHFQPAEAGRTYKIHIGFAREAPNVDAQGFNLYHNSGRSRVRSGHKSPRRGARRGRGGRGGFCNCPTTSRTSSGRMR